VIKNFESLALNTKVDSSAGVIHGVSVISTGGAKGHGLMIDQSTLDQVMACSSKYSGGLKVKLNHGSGVESICGMLRDFKMADGKLIADLHLIKTHKDYDFLLELSREIPDTFGLSISFSGVDEVKSDGLIYARCAEIYSADIVSEPAANPTGLFEAKIDNKESNMEPTTEVKPEGQDPMTCVMARLEVLEKAMAAFPAKEDKPEEKPEKEVVTVSEEEMACDTKKEDLEAKINAEVIKQLSACGITKSVSVAPVIPEPVKVEEAPKAKNFIELVAEKKIEFQNDKAKAVAFCVRNHPIEYRAALERGELQKL